MLNYFLLRFDPQTCSHDVTEFSEPAEALAALRRTEREFSDSHEIVLFMADSLDTVKSTHSSYFACAAEDNDADQAQLSQLDDSSNESLESALAAMRAEHQAVERMLAQIS